MCNDYIAHLKNMKDGAIGPREAEKNKVEVENKSWSLSQEFSCKCVTVQCIIRQIKRLIQ